MKFLRLTTLLAVALFSAVVVVPFLPATKIQSESFVLEIVAASDVAGPFQVYFNDGVGIREELSIHTPLTAGPAPVTYRLRVPTGTYQALRLDPLDRAGRVAIQALRVVSARGRIVRDLPLADFKAVQHIQSARMEAGALVVVTLPGGNDPQLTLDLSPPLVIRTSWEDNLRGFAPLFLPVFGLLTLGLVLLDRVPRLGRGVASFARALAARPVRAVALVAALAVVASAYPIVFLGKSHVSPNLGTALLYDGFPTLPGYKSAEVADVKLSDIGAVMWQHVPFSMMQHFALTQGELPLWNRFNSGGTPMLGQGQSMFGDPIHLLVIAANGAAWAWDVKYLIAKWLFASGLGLIVLAVAGAPASRRLAADAGGTPTLPGLLPVALPAALIVALAAPFIGFFLYRINHPAYFSLCYAPWALYCWVRVSQAADWRGSARWAAGLIVANLALMNSGTAKEAYMLLLCMNFSGACVLLSAGAPWRERAGKFAILGWAGVLFVLLTAPIWATFLHTLANAYTAYNAASAYQIQPGMMLGFFDEIFYRPLMSEERVFNPSVNFLVLLGFLYFLATLRHSFGNRAAMAIAVSAFVPLALAFGLVPAQWIVKVPFLSNIAHLDNTFSCALIILVSVLAGAGFAQAATRLGTREGRGDLVGAGLMLFALVFSFIGYRQAVHRPILGPTVSLLQPGQAIAVSSFVWADLVTLLMASVALALAARHALTRRTLTPALGFVIALAAMLLVWRHGLHASTMGFENYTGRPPVRTNFHARSEAMQLARKLHAQEPTRGFGFRGNFFPGWSVAYGLESLHGPEALVNPWLRDLAGQLPGVERLWDWRLYLEPANAGVARPVLDALNVRLYFDLQSDQGLLGQALKLVKTADLDVYESPTAWPRAFFTNRLTSYEQTAEFIEKIKRGDGRPFAAVQRPDLTSQPQLAALATELAGRTVVPATGYKLTGNTTSFSVKATEPGIVVLTETLWPGDFRVEVDGQRAPVIRVNHAFKGVLIANAGDHRITFRYWPRNFWRNLLLCGTGAALLAVSLAFALRRARVA